MGLGEVEQALMALPVQRSAAAPKSHRHSQGRRITHRRHRRICGQAHRGRSEGFEMDVLARHAPIRQTGHQTLHHGARTTDIELLLPTRQGALQQRQVHMAPVLKVGALSVLRQGLAVNNMQADVGQAGRNLFEFRLEGLLGTVAQAVIEMHRALRLPLQAPAQHAHHGGDANAAGHQHHRRERAGIQIKVTRRGTQLQRVAGMHMVVEIVGGDTGQKTRRHCGCSHPLDGDTVLLGLRAV